MSVPLTAWTMEPALVDEREFTPWAEPGWQSWNGMSPEKAFCDFAAMCVSMLRPELVVETGIGQGFTTRRVAHALSRGEAPPGGLRAFENDEELPSQIAALEFFASPWNEFGSTLSPTPADFEQADLTILDSEPGLRYQELSRWVHSAPNGAALIVHDCGNGHKAGTIHDALRTSLAALAYNKAVEGMFLHNPRGGFFGRRTR